MDIGNDRFNNKFHDYLPHAGHNNLPEVYAVSRLPRMSLGMRMDPAVRSGVFPADLHERADGGDLACGAMLTGFHLNPAESPVKEHQQQPD